MKTSHAIKLSILVVGMGALLFMGIKLLLDGQRGTAFEVLMTIPACLLMVAFPPRRGRCGSCFGLGRGGNAAGKT